MWRIFIYTLFFSFHFIIFLGLVAYLAKRKFNTCTQHIPTIPTTIGGPVTIPLPYTKNVKPASSDIPFRNAPNVHDSNRHVSHMLLFLPYSACTRARHIPVRRGWESPVERGGAPHRRSRLTAAVTAASTAVSTTINATVAATIATAAEPQR